VVLAHQILLTDRLYTGLVAVVALPMIVVHAETVGLAVVAVGLLTALRQRLGQVEVQH
tara:strand:+ start:242 stop:415 length:174 start_codon:yes stop_codon:yes gene_type:complete